MLVEAGLEGDLIRDQAQVRALVRWSAAASASGELAACFAAEGLEPDEASACEKEEGWILGVLPRRRGPAAAGPPRG